VGFEEASLWKMPRRKEVIYKYKLEQDAAGQGTREASTMQIRSRLQMEKSKERNKYAVKGIQLPREKRGESQQGRGEGQEGNWELGDSLEFLYVLFIFILCSLEPVLI
jgi:hypothetical protein